MTDADKKLLTEFLGECWHEWEQYDGRYLRCKNPTCLWHDKSVNETSTQGDGPFIPLDFTDWRVIGRLIEKVGGLDILEYEEFQASWIAATRGNKSIYALGDTPQEAICEAVISYLKESKP